MPQKKLIVREPYKMNRNILAMLQLALHSNDFQKLVRGYRKGNQTLRSKDGELFSVMGVLTDLYGRCAAMEIWKETNLGWEAQGVYLGKVPPEVVQWSFSEHLENHYMDFPDQVGKIRDYLFRLDENWDSWKSYPSWNDLKKVL